MTTVVEALQAATDELHNAAVLYQGRADQVAAQLAATTNNAQTIINNFTNRSPAIAIFVDENTGVDAPGRGGFDNPLKTIDYALQNTDASVIRAFFLLSDVTLRYFTALYSAVTFRGIVKTPGPYALPYSFAKRKFSFAAEALNSPRGGTGRGPAFLDIYGPSVTFDYCTITLPNTSVDMNTNWLLVPHGGSISFGNCEIQAEAAGVRSYLIEPFSTRVSVSFFAVTIGANVPGRIFASVAAGGDPRTNFLYETNLASA